MTLTEFLLARIAEDEATARAATPGKWMTAGAEWDRGWMQTGEVLSDTGASVTGTDTYGPDCAYLAAFQPARVLAECEAKRRIVERYADCVSRQSEPDYSTTEALIQSSEYEDWTLLALASVYADHPDYREEWRP